MNTTSVISTVRGIKEWAMTKQDEKKVVEKLEYIVEMTTFEELFHDGINIDIRELAQGAIKIMKGK